MSRLPDTEKTSRYDQIEDMSTLDVVTNINQEDQTVAKAVEAVLPNVAALIDQIADLKNLHWLIYILICMDRCWVESLIPQ